MTCDEKRTERSESESRRNFLKAAGTTGAAASIGGVAGCLQTAQRLRNRASGTGTEAASDGTAEVRASQESDNVVYWVLPGPRRLSETVFGTPDDPKSLIEPVIERADNQAVKQLLRDFPIPAGLPMEARAVNEDETMFTRTTIPTPFSDEGRIVSGEFDITYVDRPSGQGGDGASDKLSVDSLRFTDPAQNDYELRFKTLFEPPIPGYQTDGGVVTDTFLHGRTGTGSPLMARLYTYGASWSVGDIVANGEVVDENKVIHWMTTQIVRDQNYNLAIDEELPLAKENTIAGQFHHTHLIIQPITVTESGPAFEPLSIPFTLPNGNAQPFIHVMYEQDTVEAPFEPRFEMPTTEETPTGTPQETPAEGITVEGREYFFNPETVEANRGEEVTVTFRNAGAIAHNFTLPAFDAQTPTIRPGETASVSFTPSQTGEFPFWCAVPGHRQAGMEGTLVVQ